MKTKKQHKLWLWQQKAKEVGECPVCHKENNK